MNGCNNRIEKAKMRIGNYSRLQKMTQNAGQRANVQRLRMVKRKGDRRKRSNMFHRSYRSGEQGRGND